jgi:hypothetical protein
VLRLSRNVLGAVAALSLLAAVPSWAEHTSSVFKGVKANTGTATHAVVNGKMMLTLSQDFTPPDAPDPHWQVVDAQGMVYLLDRLMIKDGDMKGSMKLKQTITLPPYIKSVVKVQMWCAYAEVLLGEASFEKPVM